MSKQTDIICVAAEWRVLAGEEETVRQLLIKATAAIRQHEPGNLQYTIHQDVEEPAHFFIYEQYADKAALEAHRNAPHYQELILNQIIPLLTERKINFYGLLL